MPPDKIETTYAELRDDDVLIAKDGARWHVSGTDPTALSMSKGDRAEVSFWLGDARTKVRAHHMTKPASDPCTVERIATHADQAKTLEAGSALPEPAQPVDHDAAIAAVEAMFGATVTVEVSAAEADAAAKATVDDPVVLPLFERLTDLEQTSHMFVLHGVFVDDVEDRIERSKLHTAAHRDLAAGKLKVGKRYTPHVHSEAAEVIA